MRTTSVLLGLLAVHLAGSAAILKGQTPAIVPPEIAPYVPKDLRNYYLVFLVNPPTRKEMTSELFIRHQAYIRDRVAEGVFKLVGPITDGGRIRGVKIVTAGSSKEARQLAEGDPAVQSGIFDVEVYSAVFPNLQSLKIEYPSPGSEEPRNSSSP